MFMFGFYIVSFMQVMFLWGFMFLISSIFIYPLYTESGFAISPFIADYFFRIDSNDATFWYMILILIYIVYTLAGIIVSVLSYYFFGDIDC